MKNDVRESGQNRPADEEGGGTGGCGKEFSYTLPSVCLPNSWRTPIHSLSDTYPTPIRHLSDIYPTNRKCLELGHMWSSGRSHTGAKAEG